jgi:choline dehydrogenase
MGGDTFDYIIVGAGSAGCVLADRLTEDGRSSVLLLEYGGADRSIFIQMPAALSIPMNSKAYNWGYKTEPEPHLGGRRIACPRGKVLGGSSSINGMVYARGNPLDFERWEEEGAKGWGYRNVLPYFRRAEVFQGGADAYRGDAGPLTTVHGQRINPLYDAFIEAGRQAGYAVSDDLNGERQEAFGPLGMTIKDGVRWSTANAYLKPAMKRPNLEVITHALATRIAFENRRAVGIRYWRDGREQMARARREIILSGGPINSPQLLKLSGVGPEAELRALGIDVVVDRAGVGRTCKTISNSLFRSPRSNRSRFSRIRAWSAARSSGLSGFFAAAVSAPPTISRRAASSARARAFAIRTFNSISCRWLSPITARSWRKSTDSKRMPGRCGRKAEAGFA